MKRGRFIVIEGLDGCGKTTQVRLLAEKLRERGKEVVETNEPTKGLIGKLIRQVLEKKVILPSDALQLLFIADRSDHLKRTVKPALSAGKIVVSDRYFWSTIAYGSLNLDKSWLLSLHRYCLYPDVSIFLKVKPKVCLQRIGSRGKGETIFEEEEKLRRVWQTYQWLAEKFPEKVIMVDGERKPEIISREILNKILNSNIPARNRYAQSVAGG